MEVPLKIYRQSYHFFQACKDLPLPSLAKEALQRLGVETAPSSLEQDYNAGRTTQVPTGRVIAVKGRVHFGELEKRGVRR